MKYHLDRTVVLNPEPQFEKLYRWSLNEVELNGQPIGRDLIPWHWGLNFEVTELSFSSSTEPKPVSIEEYDGPGVRQRRLISAKLRPALDGSRHRTSYSMIGTSRENVNFVLNIQKLGEEESKEYCRLSGAVGFTTEIDFHDETFDDVVELYLYVHSDTFDDYANMIVSGAVEFGFLRISGVSGFYSDWSPSIYTGNIKILTHDSDQLLTRPENCDIEPPRLGRVEYVQFQLQQRLQLSGSVTETTFKDTTPVSLTDHLTNELQSKTDTRDTNLLRSFRLTAWIIIALLLVIVFK
jgi:hypothetical protein